MTNLQHQLDEADLQKRKKQLDAREESISERERLLDDSERLVKLEVLDKQIEAKQAQLLLLDERITTVKYSLKEEQYNHDAKLREYDEDYSVGLSRNKRLTAEGDQLSVLNKKLREERDRLKQDTKDLKAYLKEQEDLVNNTIAEWNVQLKEFEAEGNAIKTKKNDDLLELVNLDQEKVSLAIEINAAQDNLDALQTAYEEKSKEYKKKLSVDRNEIETLENRLKGMKKSIADRDKELVIRENAIIVKESSLRAREDDVDSRERRLQMNYRLREIPAE